MSFLAVRTYQLSLVCGALPLIVGLVIFFLWLATGWSWLEEVGFYTLLGGLVFFAAGVIALIVWFLRAGRSKFPRREKAIVSAGVLLANFPVAAAIVWSVLVIQSTYHLTIKNNSAVALRGVHFLGNGYDLDLGEILPSEKLKLKLRPQVLGESSLILRGRCGNDSFTNVVEGYYEPGGGGNAVVTVSADRKISVELLK